MTQHKRIDTGYRPHEFQAEIHKNLRRFSVLACHRRFGKTYLAVNTLIHAAMSTKKDKGRFFYVAPFRGQAKQVAWDYVKQFTRNIVGTSYREGDLIVELPNGSQIRLFGADNPDSMRGIYIDGVILDEVADMRPETWGEVIRPALSDRKGWALFIGTPKGNTNLFYELYNRATTDPNWYCAMYRADQTGLIDPEELEEAKRSMSENQYRQEFLCDWTASVDNVLITIDLVSEAVGRDLLREDYEYSHTVLGVDVARFGDDRSVICARQGLACHEPVIFQDIDNMSLASRVVQEAIKHNASLTFIDAGRGEGVIDRCRQLGLDVVEVNFGGKPDDKQYANKASEMWDRGKKWIEAGGWLPNTQDLINDMVTRMYSFDAAGRMIIEPKERMKKEGRRSPDVADAFFLTFAHEMNALAFDKRLELLDAYNDNQEEYDPFGAIA